MREGKGSAAPPVAAGEELAAGKCDGHNVLKLLDTVLITGYAFIIISWRFFISQTRSETWLGLFFFFFFAEEIKTSALENDERAAKG